MFEKKVMEMMYREADSAEDLPWHSDEPPPMLVDAARRRDVPGKALDIGCGSGVYSTYLAKRGWQVTGLDFIAKAMELARERSETEGVRVDWIQADMFSWEAPHRFDVILDSGCLHNFGRRAIPKYKKRILSWLATDGEYILTGFGRRGVFDWRPIGPRRRTREELVRIFSPELKEAEYTKEIISGVALPIGPTVLGQSFRHCCRIFY